MKYIKLFENYKEIEEICKEYNITKYIINDDQTVDVDGYVDLHDFKLIKLPLKFRNVYGAFNISYNKIISLNGSPLYVGDSFICSQNELSSIKYSPKYIGSSFSMLVNNIYSFINIGKIIAYIYYSGNPIVDLTNLFNNVYLYMEYLELYNFQKDETNIIYKSRFMEALSDFRITELPKLENYIYV